MILKVCLIGVGNWGKNYVRVIKDLNEYFQLEYIVDSDFKKKKYFENIKFESDYKKIINEVDCFFVTTPASTHYEIVKFLLENNKNVYVEKPLSLNYKESIELIDLAKINNLTLMTGYIMLYNEGVKYLKNILEYKKLNINYINIIRTGPGIIRKDCDVIYDLTVHDISILCYLIPDLKIKDITVKGFTKNKLLEMVNIDIETSDNKIIHLHTSWISQQKQREVNIICDNYQINFEDIKDNPISIYENGKINNDNIIYSPYIEWKEPLKSECEYFYKKIFDNEKDYLIDRNISKILNIIQEKINF